MASSPAEIEVFPWLKSLPLAPEYHPTLAEFRDPIAYIFKIEKEASKYGICKIVPPVSAPPKKTTIANLNRSLAARSADSTPTFTTRQQQIGFCPRKHRPVQKPVWQSGETYTLPQFEVKAKSFEKNYLKKSSKKNLTALEVETLYWKASVDKPFPVEYANDMPGSAFVQMGGGKKKGREIAVENAETLGETEWNMRGVSRANGSLLKFMKEEIPGVTSPMVYIAMLFSWFAWHVEDHDLHSLNYMHMGAAKTWYGVPKEAAVAFEDVIRVHGYGGEINPIVTFATLSEKTTVMSPEVLLSAGVPCCRLVQNAGEFVVTFPRAYHSGLSHGFNCGEAANIATPGWLRVAKDAAIRRASTNCAPMVSHFQLLYDLALSLSSRVPISIKPEPRSSRLRDKRKGEGETVVKELFVQDIMQNTDLLHILGKGSPIVILPEDALGKTICSNSRVGSLLKINPRRSTGAYTQNDQLKPTESFLSGDVIPNRKHGQKRLTGKGRFSSDFGGNRLAGGADNLSFNSTMQTENSGGERDTTECNKSPDPGIFSCVTCGVLCYACVAIIQPTEAAARYLMSANCSTISELVATSGVIEDGLTADINAITCEDANAAELNFYPGGVAKRSPRILFDPPVKQMQIVDDGVGISSPTEVQTEKSSLSLLALTYGDSSDSEDGHADEREFHVDGSSDCSLDCRSTDGDNNVFPVNPYDGAANSYQELLHQRTDLEDKNDQALFGSNKVFRERRLEWQTTLPHAESIHSSVRVKTEAMTGKTIAPVENTDTHSASRSDEDSSRMHIFCLQHASEIEQRLRPIGGVHMLLLCHQDYPKLDAEAKSVAEELGTESLWTDLEFRDASEHDKKRIQSALESAEAAHGNGDWTVKLGINLFYSASLSRSPLYSKQMPYNSVIYNAFGYSSPSSSPNRPKVSGRQKKIVVAGKWCGKVWMSNQVHPLLAKRDPEEQEEDNKTGFLGSAKLDVKLEIQSRRIRSPDTVDCAANSVMTGRKRKNNVDSRPSSVKTKFLKVEESTGKASPDTSPLLKSFRRQRKRNPRNKQIKKETTPQPHNDSSEEETRQQFDMDSNGEADGGPSTRLRKRITKQPQPSKVFSTKIEAKSTTKKQKSSKKAPKKSSSGFKAAAAAVKMSSKEDDEEAYEFCCDVEGCTMSFSTKQELLIHKKNICPVKGCGKKFFSHKYLVQHRRVHTDDRPLKCPWKGCKMTFKWAWARTEHIRVHTGARPYVCNEEGCGQTFRFVSDFSRHKRRTGHSTKK